MKILGLTITRTKAAVGLTDLSSLMPSSGNGWTRIWESFTGAWQRNIVVDRSSVLVFSTVFACMTLIASDISKLWLCLMQKDSDGIWTEVENSAYSPVLRKPNRFQNRIQFIEHWMLSKLSSGNTYVLKARDSRKVVKALYILDPARVKPLVAPDGAVYYDLGADQLSGIDEQIVVPASEMIHDRMNCLFHPLIGLSPLVACGLAATQGLKIQTNSARMFANGLKISGVLTAPGAISQVTADRLEAHWNANYMGDDAFGKVAALGDGLKFEPMTMKAIDAQAVEQLKMSREDVCSTFHVPGWKVGIAPMPAYGNVQAGNIEYYAEALQNPIEAIELCLDEGLDLATDLGVELDVDALLRMDTLTQMEIATKGVGAAIYSPNEGRSIFGKKPVDGGDQPFLQEQNWPIKLLAQREIPTRPPTAPAQTMPTKAITAHMTKGFAERLAA